MSIWWDQYEIYDPGVFGPWRELPRGEARAAYERLMEARPRRRLQLRDLVLRHGVVLGDDDASIHHLDEWFCANVSGDRRTQDHPEPDALCALLPEWYSVVSDISLFLGDVLIDRDPSLRWEFFTRGEKNLSYQQNVIAGFDAPNPRYHLNIDFAVAGLGHQIVWGLPVPAGTFLSIADPASH